MLACILGPIPSLSHSKVEIYDWNVCRLEETLSFDVIIAKLIVRLPYSASKSQYIDIASYLDLESTPFLPSFAAHHQYPAMSTANHRTVREVGPYT